MSSTDRDALVALYGATDGANWLVSNHWNTNADLSLCFGVTVLGGRVVRLCLPFNNLEGTSGTHLSCNVLDLPQKSTKLQGFVGVPRAPALCPRRTLEYRSYRHPSAEVPLRCAKYTDVLPQTLNHRLRAGALFARLPLSVFQADKCLLNPAHPRYRLLSEFSSATTIFGEC